MAQVKIYARHSHLDQMRDVLSDAIHRVLQNTLGLPVEKRFHRFFALDEVDIRHPADRSERYTILEIVMFAGRTDATKRACLQALMAEIPAVVGMPVDDLEIVLIESPKVNWGIRGRVGDALQLSYKVET